MAGAEGAAPAGRGQAGVRSHQGHADSRDFVEVLDQYRSGRVPLAEIERRYILSVLEQFGGNQVRAAAALGIDRSKLYRRLKEYGVMAVRFLQQEDKDGMRFRRRCVRYLYRPKRMGFRDPSAEM